MNPTETYDCDQVFARLDDYLDRELSSAEVERLEAHIRLCEHCALDERFERGTLDELKRKLSRLSVPAALRARIQATIANERGRRDPDRPR